MSRTGLLLCAVYLVVCVACVTAANSSGADPKGTYVFLQLPIVLQMSLVYPLLSISGLLPWVQDVSWFWTYVGLALPTFPVLYLFGSLIDRANRRQWSIGRRPLDKP